MPDRDWIEMIAAELGRTNWPGRESSWGKNRIWIHPLKGTKTYILFSYDSFVEESRVVR